MKLVISLGTKWINLLRSWIWKSNSQYKVTSSVYKEFVMKFQITFPT